MNEIKMETNIGYMKLNKEEDKPIRGFIFTCSNKTESECLNRLLFGTDRIYGPVVIRIRKGDLLFLINIDMILYMGYSKQLQMAILKSYQKHGKVNTPIR